MLTFKILPKLTWPKLCGEIYQVKPSNQVHKRKKSELFNYEKPISPVVDGFGIWR